MFLRSTSALTEPTKDFHCWTGCPQKRTSLASFRFSYWCLWWTYYSDSRQSHVPFHHIRFWLGQIAKTFQVPKWAKNSRCGGKMQRANAGNMYGNNLSFACKPSAPRCAWPVACIRCPVWYCRTAEDTVEKEMGAMHTARKSCEWKVLKGYVHGTVYQYD
jgi:hypothetical protein